MAATATTSAASSTKQSRRLSATLELDLTKFFFYQQRKQSRQQVQEHLLLLSQLEAAKSNCDNMTTDSNSISDNSFPSSKGGRIVSAQSMKTAAVRRAPLVELVNVSDCSIGKAVRFRQQSSHKQMPLLCASYEQSGSVQICCSSTGSVSNSSAPSQSPNSVSSVSSVAKGVLLVGGGKKDELDKRGNCYACLEADTEKRLELPERSSPSSASSLAQEARTQKGATSTTTTTTTKRATETTIGIRILRRASGEPKGACELATLPRDSLEKNDDDAEQPLSGGAFFPPDCFTNRNVGDNDELGSQVTSCVNESKATEETEAAWRDEPKSLVSLRDVAGWAATSTGTSQVAGNYERVSPCSSARRAAGVEEAKVEAETEAETEPKFEDRKIGLANFGQHHLAASEACEWRSCFEQSREEAPLQSDDNKPIADYRWLVGSSTESTAKLKTSTSTGSGLAAGGFASGQPAPHCNSRLSSLSLISEKHSPEQQERAQSKTTGEGGQEFISDHPARRHSNDRGPLVVRHSSEKISAELRESVSSRREGQQHACSTEANSYSNIGNNNSSDSVLHDSFGREFSNSNFSSGPDTCPVRHTTKRPLCTKERQGSIIAHQRSPTGLSDSSNKLSIEEQLRRLLYLDQPAGTKCKDHSSQVNTYELKPEAFVEETTPTGLRAGLANRDRFEMKKSSQFGNNLETKLGSGRDNDYYQSSNSHGQSASHNQQSSKYHNHSSLSPDDRMMIFMMASRRAATNSSLEKNARILKWLHNCRDAK